MTKKIFGAISAMALFALPMVTSAATGDIWTTASSTEQYGLVAAALAVLFALVIGSVLGAWASLTGLGFGLRKVKRYVTGRHF